MNLEASSQTAWLARTIMSVLQTRAALRFERQVRRPGQTQWNTLSRILQGNRDTEVGRRFDFASIRNPADYQRRVPLVGADDLSGPIARMAAGEHAVLTAQQPRYFCQTSGTTGRQKLTPITHDYVKEYQGTIHTWLHYIRRDYPDIFEGKAMYLVGTAEGGRTSAGIPFGTMTGFNFTTLPSFMKRLYALPYEYTQVDNYEAKYYAALRIGVPQDVRFLISVTPNTLLLLGRKLRHYQEQLVADIEKGGLWEGLSISAPVRLALAPFLRPDLIAGRRLRTLLDQHGCLRPVDVWPNLRLLACWKSGPSAPYLREFAALYGDTPVRDAIYSATEGWMNIPMSDQTAGGALAVGTHFFEFFEEQDRERRGPALLAEDLQVGCRYAIVLTASSGMYRYDIGDVVLCTAMYRRTPVIAFSHKECGFCNLVGEKLNDSDVSAAVATAVERSGLSPILFTFAPRKTVPPSYRAIVEFATPLGSDAQGRAFLEAFDRQLRENAFEYNAHRQMGDLGSPALIVLKPGSNDRYRRTFLQNGGNEAQLKPRHLGDDASFLDDLEVERQLELGGTRRA